jgi:parallel beta-helix repeat protein
MKIIHFCLAILVPIILGIFPANGNSYYFSSTNGDDSRTATQAGQSGTPWRSLAKLNQVSGQLKPGDSVLFKRGDVFYGTLVIRQSGASGSPIVFAAYGQGSDPVISGFVRLGGWKSVGNGIWQTACPGCGLRVNMVTIGDTVQQMGRFPNTGYFKIQAHSANTAITDNNLVGGPDWTGADLVIRKNRFILDRNIIVSQQGGVLTYKGGAYYAAADKFGYFIQNDIRTLDQNGEWYYDPKTHLMNAFFGPAGPPADVMASSIDTLVSISGKQWLVFRGLTFLGSNGNAFSLTDASNVTIAFCGIFFSSLDAVLANRSSNLNLSNLAVEHSDNNGIDLTGSNNLITDCRVGHTGNIPGMGNAETSYIGINIKGDNNTVQYNTVDTTGYVGIFFQGSANAIKNNSVDYFTYIKDDGGGIYTWSGDIDSAGSRNIGIISGNIVMNGITATSGTDSVTAGIANGIYLDENTMQTEVSNNTVAHCTTGVFVHDSHEITVKGNTLFDNTAAIGVRRSVIKAAVRNNEISGNTAVSAKSNENVLLLSSAVSGDVSNFANFHDNYYAQPASGTSFFRTVVRQNNNNVQEKGGLSDFQSKYGKESNSVVSPAAAIRLEYNASKKVKVVALDRMYKDPTGKTFQGQLSLQPYGSEILIPQ